MKIDFVNVTRGLDIGLAGVPDHTIIDTIATDTASLDVNVGGERRTTLTVAVGDRVKLGEPLLLDRDCPGLNHTSPVCGIVKRIDAASRRRVNQVVIERDGEEAIQFPQHTPLSLEQLTRAEIRELLLVSGTWSAIRARPFDRIALPTVVPRALFVTAMDTNPLAPDPATVLASQAAEFEIGLLALSKLSSGPTYVCCAPCFSLTVPEGTTIRTLQFAGPHPAGLPGTHIHSVGLNVNMESDLWYIGYQDVAAIGSLLLLGRPTSTRIIASGGHATTRPRLVKMNYGADLSWCKGEANCVAYRTISGSVLNGAGPAQFLGRYHNQITLLPERTDDSAERRSWRQLARDLFRGARPHDAVDTLLAGWPSGMLPLEVFDTVWPFNFPPAPLLRALLTGDADAALTLGCIGLAPEDLALCSYVCPAKSDYGAALRATLQTIERQR